MRLSCFSLPLSLSLSATLPRCLAVSFLTILRLPLPLLTRFAYCSSSSLCLGQTSISTVATSTASQGAYSLSQHASLQLCIYTSKFCIYCFKEVHTFVAFKGCFNRKFCILNNDYENIFHKFYKKQL